MHIIELCTNGSDCNHFANEHSRKPRITQVASLKHAPCTGKELLTDAKNIPQQPHTVLDTPVCYNSLVPFPKGYPVPKDKHRQTLCQVSNSLTVEKLGWFHNAWYDVVGINLLCSYSRQGMQMEQHSWKTNGWTGLAGVVELALHFQKGDEILWCQSVQMQPSLETVSLAAVYFLLPLIQLQ